MKSNFTPEQQSAVEAIVAPLFKVRIIKSGNLQIEPDQTDFERKFIFYSTPKGIVIRSGDSRDTTGQGYGRICGDPVAMAEYKAGRLDDQTVVYTIPTFEEALRRFTDFYQKSKYSKSDKPKLKYKKFDFTGRCISVDIDKLFCLQITAINHNEALSRDSNQFSAVLFCNGERIGEASDDGWGGMTDVSIKECFLTKELKNAISQIESFEINGKKYYYDINSFVAQAVYQYLCGRKDWQFKNGKEIVPKNPVKVYRFEAVDFFEVEAHNAEEAEKLFKEQLLKKLAEPHHSYAQYRSV